jgi:uncharacterized protein YjeT (DUF2065 family)
VSVWNFITAEQLIALSQNGNYGLAPARWRQQLEQIRSLPERPAEDERRAA